MRIRAHNWLWYLFWPVFGLVVFLAFAPGPGIPWLGDKVEHFLAFGGLAAVGGLAGGRRYALWILLGLVALGGSLEIIQGLTGRDASWSDEFYNSLGAAAGILAAMALIRIPWFKRRSF